MSELIKRAEEEMQPDGCTASPIRTLSTKTMGELLQRIEELESPWHNIKKDGFPNHDGEVLVFYAEDISPPIEIDYMESDPDTGAEYFANDPEGNATYWCERPSFPLPSPPDRGKV